MTYSTSLSASYEIDFWGKNRAALRAAEELAVASRFDREVVALTTVVSVANSYFLVLEANDRLRIARDNLAAATRVYNLIKQRFDVGTASALDTAQQESLVNTQRASIPPLEQTLRQNIATLAVLIGRTPESVTVRGGSMSRLAIPPVTPGLPSDLIAQRPDIREAEAQLASANANVYSARAAMFPSIQLTGEGGYQSALLKTLLRPESAFYNVAAGLTQPIFDGLRLQGLLDFQVGRQDELLQLYRKAIVNGFADVERALIAVQQTARRERLQRDVVTKLAEGVRHRRDAAAGGHDRSGHPAPDPADAVHGPGRAGAGPVRPPDGGGLAVSGAGRRLAETQGGWACRGLGSASKALNPR